MSGFIVFLIFMLPAMALGFYAQRKVTGNFRRFSGVPSSTGMTGAQVARMILDRNGLTDVEVRMVPGELSDHYDPRNRTVNLSEAVYSVNSVAAVSVAAHEVGHAIQHQQSYVPLKFRSALAPAATFGSNAFNMLILLGFALLFMAQSVVGYYAIIAGVGLYTFAVLFQIVTLPVEFNASSRARAQMETLGLIPVNEREGTAKVLNAAALTYVAGALMAISTLLYYVLMFVGNRD